MLNMVLHLKWLPNVFELWKLVHREAPEVNFFLTPGVGRLSVQLRQHNKLLCLILEAGKKCCSGSLVWVNLNNSNESDLHSRWGTWFCMLEMRSSQRLILMRNMRDMRNMRNERIRDMNDMRDRWELWDMRDMWGIDQLSPTMIDGLSTSRMYSSQFQCEFLKTITEWLTYWVMDIADSRDAIASKN